MPSLPPPTLRPALLPQPPTAEDVHPLRRNRPAITRALLGARAVRLLEPAALAAGGFASAVVRVPVPPGGGAPLAVIGLGAAPVDGVLCRVPLVAVLAGPALGAPAHDPMAWLAAGARAVWVLGDGDAVQWTGKRPIAVPAGGVLTVPRRPTIRLPLATLWA